MGELRTSRTHATVDERRTRARFNRFLKYAFLGLLFFQCCPHVASECPADKPHWAALTLSDGFCISEYADIPNGARGVDAIDSEVRICPRFTIVGSKTIVVSAPSPLPYTLEHMHVCLLVARLVPLCYHQFLAARK